MISENNNGNNKLVSVCICTFKRPEMLKYAIENVLSQVTKDELLFEIVVVDNDIKNSAESVINEYKRQNINIIYDCEPEQNIARARNRAIKNANGSFIAFIDDDEFPVSHWLINLYDAIKKYNVDGVLGPVLPHFNNDPPAWLIKGKFCERERMPTGKVLHWDDTRTGNVLFKKKIYNEKQLEFDKRLGRTGGEDVDFFKRAIMSGCKFIWCDEAPVYEVVPEDRWTKTFYLKKYFRIGGLNGKRKRKENCKFKLLVKYIVATIIYSLLLPLSIVAGYHNFLKYSFKLAYNCAWIIAFSGIHLNGDR
jgi:succinoglycan biosynthesis protein ExoM